MLMICDDEDVQPSPQDIACDPGHRAWIEEMDRRGVLLGGERLRPSSDATTVRTRDGEVLVSDGSFVETKEQIGGFALIECKDLDEAIRSPSTA